MNYQVSINCVESSEGYSISVDRLYLTYRNKEKTIVFPVENGGGIFTVFMKKVYTWTDKNPFLMPERKEVKKHIIELCEQGKWEVHFDN